jgi:lipoprotein-anchoring transpeptidase ErfK/SrfK
MNSSSSNERFRFVSTKLNASVPGLLLILLFIGIGLGLVFLPVSPVRAAIFSTITPTQENLWALVDLPKPTYTPTAILPPTETPALEPTATATPGSMVMEIVNDTAVPAYAPKQQLVAASSYGGSKYILVDISEQHMYVYEGDALVYSFVASTGMNNATRIGNFAVQSKIPNAYGATWDIWMPSWLGIYWSGGLENGIHALPILPNGATLWAGFLGRPVSYGCVVLGSYEAKLLYDWAEIGTPVEIQW